MPDPDRAAQSDIRPNRARYNDWRQLDAPAPEAFAPTLPVSVIVPCCGMPEALARTLAALERQTWPRRLFEVVVVDAGSGPPLAPPSSPLDVRVVRRDGTDSSLAAARNAGAAAAAHPILVFLDCGALPEAECLAAHARWHHLVRDALTVGKCACVDVRDIGPAAIRDRGGSLEKLFAGRECDPPSSEKHIRNTNGLTGVDDAPFRVVDGGNLGIGKAFFESTGGFDESLVGCGFDDSEFGYRAYARGALLVPDGKTLAWRQNRGQPARPPEHERSSELYRARLAHLVPHPRFRSPAPGRSFAVPQRVATVHAGARTAGAIAGDVETLLAEPAGDLVVRIELTEEPGSHRALLLRERFGPDPRVSIAAGNAANPALHDFPLAAFHLSVPAGACGRGLVQRLHAALGNGAAARLVVSDAGVATITRTWALHRSRRTGLPVEHFGDVVTVFPGPASSSPARAAPPQAGERARAVRRMLREARTVRDARSAARFFKWLAPRVLNRLRRAPPFPARRRAAGAGHADAQPSVGVAESSTGAAEPSAGAAEPSTDTAERSTVGSTAASGLPEPSFDIAFHNPVDWLRNADDHVGALGPVELLPAGARIPRTVSEADLQSIRLCHHLVDIDAFHRSPRRRAQTLIRLLAAGAPVHVLDREPELGRLLGPELFELAAGDDIRTADTARREQISVRMRRIALRDHSTYGRDGTGERSGLPSVSILLAASRPRLLEWAIANIARQNYPRVELILALHGPGFDQVAVDRALEPLRIRATVVRVADPQLSCATVLNAATAAAGGTLVAKMDDDDLYDEHHIWDLVLARAYSDADIVGKRSEGVYLMQSGKTLRRRYGEGERFVREVSGNSLLVARQTVNEANGWPRVWLQDYALIDAVLGIGGSVYRTHGSGMIIVRHGESHIWHKTAADFLAGAEEIHDGWRPSIAGFSGSVPPPPSPLLRRERGPEGAPRAGSSVDAD